MKHSAEAKKTTVAVAPNSLMEAFFRPGTLFRLSLLAGVCALWPYAAQRLPSLAKRAEYQTTFSAIQISPTPTGPVPANLVEQVERQFDVSRELSILDERLAADVAEAFRQHPWVARVVSVRKSFPAAIRVELEYRRPVAMVQVPGGRIPIDLSGVVLPTADFSANDLASFPLIQNIAPSPSLRPGSVWKDPALQSAAKLANLLRDKWQPLKLEAIFVPREDPSSDPKDVSLVLIGQGSSRILWGRAPGSDHPGELEPVQKIRRLENYLTEFGDYTQPKGPYEIDIRHWRENSRRPLVSEQSQAKPPKNLQSSEGKRKTRS
ncbi:cell division protein FtsQ/DivIB [Schlesneria paludicola]|uniref:cell division protein FtsQ/DivIB n=1 Tax=Schlesneria paludicola TaxID=360056 RepID=UPI0012F97471|nr:hypothetical protein [Schlesneria paludicola]